VHPENDYFSISSYYIINIDSHPRFLNLFPRFPELLRVIPSLELAEINWIIFATCQTRAAKKMFDSISWALGFFQKLKCVHIIHREGRVRGGPPWQLKLERGRIKMLDVFRRVFEQRYKEHPNVRIPQITTHSSSEHFAKTIP
jgi:hypothetical protein